MKQKEKRKSGEERNMQEGMKSFSIQKLRGDGQCFDL